jgi:hypothetical protein
MCIIRRCVMRSRPPKVHCRISTPPPSVWYQELIGRDVKLTTHLLIVYSLEMSGATPPLLHTRFAW